MAFLRGIFIGIMCVLWTAVAHSPAVATNPTINKVGTTKSSSGGAGKGTANAAMKACSTPVKPKPSDPKYNEELEYYNKYKNKKYVEHVTCLQEYKDLDPNSKNMQAATAAECIWTTPNRNGPKVLTCSAKRCKEPWYLVVTKDHSTLTGNCAQQKTCSKGQRPTPPFLWKTSDGQTVKVLDLICKKTDCDQNDVIKNNAKHGTVDEKTNNCILQECNPGYYLSRTTNRCIKCKDCNPTHANCKFISADITGNGSADQQCIYETSCETGFEDEQNHGKYNPSCSPVSELESLDCTDDELKEIHAIAGYKLDGRCVATDCLHGAYDLQDGKCVPLQENLEIKEIQAMEEEEEEEENVRIINVKFEQNGGTGCEDKKIVKTDASETVIDCEPSQDNMVFDGWCLNAGLTNCSATQTLSATDSGDKIFYAKWRKAETTDPTPITTPKKQTTCEPGYKLVDGKCVGDGIEKAQKKYDAAKENEQSLENRTLGSLTMAATGIGGMELAQGLSEQKADKAADADMLAYLATFQCKVGDKRYSGGDSQIEIPGGNELINLYQEYMNLANDLKERKTALGKKAGIESEVVLDKANMGLYDEVGHGIENGTYASLYRASKGNETDTQKIDDTKSASKKRVIAGAVVGGAGAVGGMVGNSAINGKLGEAIQGLKDNSSFDLGSFDLDSETVSKLQNVFGNDLNGDIFSKLQGAFGDKLQNLDSGTLSKLTSAFGNKLQNVDGDTLNQLQSEYGSDLNNMSKADILKATRNIKAKN